MLEKPVFHMFVDGHDGLDIFQIIEPLAAGDLVHLRLPHFEQTMVSGMVISSVTVTSVAEHAGSVLYVRYSGSGEKVRQNNSGVSLPGAAGIMQRMIQLTDEQRAAVDKGDVVRITAPDFGHEVVLVRADLFDSVSELLQEERERRVISGIAMRNAAENQGIESLADAPYEEWSRALRDWMASHDKRETAADWSRDSIYADPDQ